MTARPAGAFLELALAAGGAGRFIADADGRIGLAALDGASNLDIGVEACRGKSVLVLTARQLPAVLAAAALDGVARRIVLAPPDLAAEHLPLVLADAEADILLHDGAVPPPPGVRHGRCGALKPEARPRRDRATQWLLFTSGTTGRPKLVVHSLASLAGPLDVPLDVPLDGRAAPGTVWSTFYDVRRYGGLQILLRACLGGGSLVLSEAGETGGAFLRRAGAAGVTHISGTPSHWRQALMSPQAAALAPAYIRLSGEVADQAILNQIKKTWPDAAVAHAFASTEAGVGFDVRDGLAGFPAGLVGAPGAVQIRVRDGSLRLRSPRAASGYAGVARPLADAEGFVDTGDMVELRGGRYYFAGRREGIINVGGLKVHPEEVEAVLNQHPAVRMSRVRGRRSPITGAIVVAEFVPFEPAGAEAAEDVLRLCRRQLPPHKVPATLRPVAALELAASGKLRRFA